MAGLKTRANLRLFIKTIRWGFYQSQPVVQVLFYRLPQKYAHRNGRTTNEHEETRMGNRRWAQIFWRDVFLGLSDSCYFVSICG